MKQTIDVSPSGSINSHDWKSLGKTLLFQIAAAVVTVILGFLAYLDSTPDKVPWWLILALPSLQLTFTQPGKFLQKLIGGPPVEVVEDANRGVLPVGYAYAAGLKKLDAKKLV